MKYLLAVMLLTGCVSNKKYERGMTGMYNLGRAHGRSECLLEQLRKR